MADQLNIMCLTWNLETEDPDQEELKQFFKEIIKTSKLGKPDIVAVGIQEGNSGTKFPILLETALPEYYCIGSANFAGLTKASQIWPWNPLASQGLYLLINTKTIHIPEKGAATKGATANIETKQKKSMREKGYVLGDITYKDRRIGFVSTHAEVKEEKRDGDFATIVAGLITHAEEGKYHAIFYMGDLNYRLKRKADEKNTNDLVKEREDIFKKMATSKGRETLYKLDTFKEPKMGGACTMKWPDFDPQCLPTYKRIKKKDGAASHLKNLVDPNNYPIPTLEKLFPLHPSDKGGACWDFGWLDRIGHADGSAVGKIMAPGLKLKSMEGLFGGNSMAGGDHAPVYAHFLFDIVATK